MNFISRELETDRLVLKVPTMSEQKALWEILRLEEVNCLYMPTPGRFEGDRKAFLEALNNWEKQEKFYKKKIDCLGENSNMFTWSIFLKSGEVIGQITCQPHSDYEDYPAFRDIGWFIDPKYQGLGYGTEAADEVVKYMFEVVGIEKIDTSAAIINPGSWRIMEKVGFVRVGEKDSPYTDELGEVIRAYQYVIDKERFNEFK